MPRHRGTVRAIVLAAALLAPGCAREGGTAPGDAPRVIATIFPLGDLAARVGGDDVRVEVLVPPRADPSTFEPSARQIRDLTGARGYLMVGGGMDEWLDAVPGALDEIPRARMNDGIALPARAARIAGQ